MSSSENPSQPISITRDTSECLSDSCPSGTFNWTPVASGQETLAALPDDARDYVIEMMTGLAHAMSMSLGVLLDLAAKSPEAFYSGAQTTGLAEMVNVARLKDLADAEVSDVTIAVIDLSEFDLDDIDEDDDMDTVLRKMGLSGL